MIHVIYIYFIINSFLLGKLYLYREPIKVKLTTFFFGSLMLVLDVLYGSILGLIEFLNNYFKISFFWNWYLYKKIDKEFTSDANIKLLNRNFPEISKRKGLKARLWVKGYHIIKRYKDKN